VALEAAGSNPVIHPTTNKRVIAQAPLDVISRDPTGVAPGWHFMNTLDNLAPKIRKCSFVEPVGPRRVIKLWVTD
jgi:hypothetical protein